MDVGHVMAATLPEPSIDPSLSSHNELEFPAICCSLHHPQRRRRRRKPPPPAPPSRMFRDSGYIGLFVPWIVASLFRHLGAGPHELNFRHEAFLKGLKGLKVANENEHKALVLSGLDDWSCHFQSLNLIMQVVNHCGPLADLSFSPVPKGFVPYMLGMMNADHSVRGIQPLGEDFEGVEEVDPPSTSYSVLADDLALPTPSFPNDVPSGPAPIPQSPSPVAVDDASDDTRPGGWICLEWYTAPPTNHQNADGQLKNDQEFCTKLQTDLKISMNPTK